MKIDWTKPLYWAVSGDRSFLITFDSDGCPIVDDPQANRFKVSKEGTVIDGTARPGRNWITNEDRDKEQLAAKERVEAKRAERKRASQAHAELQHIRDAAQF